MAAADRIAACLEGIATGDAIGKQTETLSREDVLRWYPQGIRGFDGRKPTRDLWMPMPRSPRGRYDTIRPNGLP